MHTVHTVHTVHTAHAIHTVPYRTVPYRAVPYRTVPYRTVPTRIALSMPPPAPAAAATALGQVGWRGVNPLTVMLTFHIGEHTCFLFIECRCLRKTVPVPTAAAVAHCGSGGHLQKAPGPRAWVVAHCGSGGPSKAPWTTPGPAAGAVVST